MKKAFRLEENLAMPKDLTVILLGAPQPCHPPAFGRRSPACSCRGPRRMTEEWTDLEHNQLGKVHVLRNRSSSVASSRSKRTSSALLNSSFLLYGTLTRS